MQGNQINSNQNTLFCPLSSSQPIFPEFRHCSIVVDSAILAIHSVLHRNRASR